MTISEARSVLHCPDAYGGIYGEKYGEALNMAMQALPKGEWISPKVALPEEDSFVLVTINARGRRRVRSSFYMNKLFMNDNGDTWRVTDKHLVAWMYSPEPCGAETELKKKVNK